MLTVLFTVQGLRYVYGFGLPPAGPEWVKGYEELPGACGQGDTSEPAVCQESSLPGQIYAVGVTYLVRYAT